MVGEENAALELMKRLLESTKGENAWAEANKPFALGDAKLDPKTESLITRLDVSQAEAKKLVSFKTDTMIDLLFLDSNGKAINGIPFGSTAILTGLPNSGKSLFVEEMALRLASAKHKVCYVTSEEVFRSKTARFDLESRLKEKAYILKFDWQVIAQNLFVLDAVSCAELRDWATFASTYRHLAEKEKIEMLLIDSITLLEDSRGQLKYRVSELSKYGQMHGISSIMISQRSIEESDTLAMAGGIGLSHIVDIVMTLDWKRLSSWDATIKQDLQAKQGETTYFFRILKCRMCRFVGNYIGYEITKDGFVRLRTVPTIPVQQPQ